MEERKGYRFVKCTTGTQPEGTGALRKIRVPFRVLRKIAHAYQTMEGIGDDEVWDSTYQKIAEVVPEWNLVDSEGKPLPQPKDDYMVFDELDDEELRWIFSEVLRGPAAPNA